MLTKLYLQQFRNHQERLLDFSGKRTLLVGPNGAGKTTIFEAIVLLATGASFRASSTSELIAHDSQVAHLGMVVEGSHLTPSPTQVEMTLSRGVIAGRRVAPKTIRINKVGRAKAALTGVLPVVVFRPEDMRLIEGGPHRRRAWMDDLLSQLSKDYQRALSTYSRALIRRNKTLSMVREGRSPVSTLEFWNQLMIESGAFLSRERMGLIESLNQTSLLQQVELELVFQGSLITPERIAEYQPREIAAGHTLIGPHRDDIVVMSVLDASRTKRSVTDFGSRGQERIAIAYLKLASASLLESKLGVAPIILLDDIFSELDTRHRDWVLANTLSYQSIISTADPHTIAGLDGRVVELGLEADDHSGV